MAYSTASSYLSLCRSIREKWGSTTLDKFRPLDFQNWLKSLESQPKTKGHLKAFDRLYMNIKEGVVNGRIGPVKTECSEDDIPLDPDFATILLEWKRKSN